MSLNVNLPASGLVLLENKVVTGAAVTSLVFSGLNGDIDEIYQLYFRFLNPVAANGTVAMAANFVANTTAFFLFNNIGSTASGAAGTAGQICRLHASSPTTGSLKFFAKTGSLRIWNGDANEPDGLGAYSSGSYSTRCNDTATNVTSLTLTSSVVGGIGIGSQALLFKVQQNAYSFVQNAPAQFNPTTIQTGAYAATVNDLVRVNPTGGGFTVTLPQPGALNRGMVIAVKNVTSSTNVITVASAGGGTIDGVASKTYNTAFFEMEFISDGSTNWAQR